MDDDVLEWFEERSAIIQEVTGCIAADADFAAFALTVAWCNRTGHPLPATPYFTNRKSWLERLVFDDATGSARYGPGKQ